ncbi:MAG TPA: beta-eliminating lyase-related protein [Bryobacteraceae bacterium]|nr:beta-eliminating lyase-related protein [Bryobacteraceae bacterium]
MRRRSFFATPLAASLAAAQSAGGPAGAPVVHATGDGIPHSPHEYAQLLAKLTASGEVEPDDFSRGGIVQKLEERTAALLGKEAAVWMPTGTLANHMAVRRLAGTKRRVLVQAESHLFNDTGDCAQELSGLHLVPLGAGRATFGLDEVERAWSQSQQGRVATPIGAIQIETPVRRRLGERFDSEQMRAIAAWARDRKVGLHLDGARVFVESAYTKRPVKDYAVLFDTVYVSLYKYFNAASGAILAGPKDLIADMYHERRMFGGALQQAWPSAAVALHYLDGFEKDMSAAVQTSEAVIAELSSDPNFAVERIPNGTNIFRLKTPSVNAPVYQARLQVAGILARTPSQDTFAIQVNPTWARIRPQEIVARFRTALG